MASTKQQTNIIRTVGRRKTSAARARFEKGTGKITVNDKDFNQYFPIAFWQKKMLAPLTSIGREKDFDITIKVLGGGVNSQAEAVKHAIARALIKWDETLKPVLKAEGFLTRDARAKERKKPGLRRARRAHQWRKR